MLFWGAERCCAVLYCVCNVHMVGDGTYIAGYTKPFFIVDDSFRCYDLSTIYTTGRMGKVVAVAVFDEGITNYTIVIIACTYTCMQHKRSLIIHHDPKSNYDSGVIWPARVRTLRLIWFI